MSPKTASSTVAQAWELSKGVLAPSGAAQTDCEHLRQAFYAGAISTLNVLAKAIHSGEQIQLLNALEALSRELQTATDRCEQSPVDAGFLGARNLLRRLERTRI